MLSFQDVTGVKGFISDQQIESVQFYLSDIDGRLRAVTIPAETFSEETLEMGIGFDASNFGFAGVERSDMILKPDLSHAFLDPIEGGPRVLCFFCHMMDVDGEARFTQDVRYLLPRTLAVLASEGIADAAKMGVELEFHVIDQLFSVRNPREQSFRVETSEMVTDPPG